MTNTDIKFINLPVRDLADLQREHKALAVEILDKLLDEVARDQRIGHILTIGLSCAIGKIRMVRSEIIRAAIQG